MIKTFKEWNRQVNRENGLLRKSYQHEVGSLDILSLIAEICKTAINYWRF